MHHNLMVGDLTPLQVVKSSTSCDRDGRRRSCEVRWEQRVAMRACVCVSVRECVLGGWCVRACVRETVYVVRERLYV